MRSERDPSFAARMVDLLPTRWPVRRRIAAASAALTFVILVAFALVVGRLVSDRLHDDLDNDLRDTANRIAFDIHLVGQAQVSPDVNDMMVAGAAAVRVVDASGRVLDDSGGAWSEIAASPDALPLRAGVTNVDSFAVATAPIVTNALGAEAYVQYARSTEDLQATIGRLWLFLAGGVLVGTALATLAGLAVAGRAMRPISGLTAAAREIASTRDPSRRLPQPHSDDEVAELARTLDDMLRELDASRAEAEQMVQAQREFVADASHELRTPLTSILANLELLQARLGDGDGDEVQMVDSALRSSQRMRRLVADLLLLARADAGTTGVRHPCDLAEITEAAVAEVRPVSDGHEVKLHAADPVPVDGNPDELHRLVLNLLENGVRHTPQGTDLDVTVARSNGDAVLEVSDDGPGLPEGTGDQLFSRFVRGNGPGDVSPDSGTGLGLAIVLAVATAHGGDVTAGQSESGGARFTIRLPLMSRGSDNF